MSKKKLYLLIGITAIITIGFFLAAYIITRQGNDTGTESKNPFENFFPFGKDAGNTDTSTPDVNQNINSGINSQENNPTGAQQGLIPALRKISTTATAGADSTTKSDKTVIRFVERSTGNIFETNMEDMRRDRISNAIMPRIEEASFGDTGGSIVYRYLKEVSSSIITFIRKTPNPDKPKTDLGEPATPAVIDGSFLTENILNTTLSSDKKNMFYLVKTDDFNTGGSIGSIFNFQKNTSTQVFQSPFSEWQPVYFDGKTVLLQTKPSQDVPGFLYSVILPNGELQKIIGGINGLTALPSPDLKKILYSESTSGGISLHLYDRMEKKSTDIELETLPEKCVWSADSITIYCAAPDYLPTALYPDDWYQGSLSFSDAMWEIYSETANVSVLFLPGMFTTEKLDMTHLTLSPKKDFLFFINKTDSALWGYKLNN